MPHVDEFGRWLEQHIFELMSEHRVPAASVAVSVGERVFEVAAGALSTGTGVAATTDSLFQIGSVTKVLTTTLAMQAVDDGLLELDAPVQTYLPGFRVADADASARITVRHLMTHTAGFEGDIFTDTGKGDDCIALFVDGLRDTPQLFPPGEMFSYNNAGMCVLGRIIEVVRGKPFDQCMREHLFTPLGLAHAANDAYEAILHRTAIGHLDVGTSGRVRPATVWAMARSNAPAGSMLAMSAPDLLEFARMHLRGGRARSGRVVLSAESAAAMRERQVEQPATGDGAGWGLGWELFDDAGELIGHDGNTIGQSAFLRLVPGADLAVAVLVNGGDSGAFGAAVLGAALRRLTSLEPASPPVPDPLARPADVEKYVGRYVSSTSATVVEQDTAGRLWLERTPLGEVAALGEPVFRTELVSWREDTLLPLEAERGVHSPIAFLGDDGNGRAMYLHTGRADPRALR